MKWEKVSLESISTRIGDGLHGTPQYDDSGEFYFINGNNLSNGKILIKEDTKRISSIEYDKIKKELSDKTVLVAINGTLGNIGLYRDEPVALGKSSCYINVSDKVEKLFIRYVLENQDFQRYARDFATGSTIKNLGLKAVRDYSFNLPPLPTQRKIAAILSAYDDLIENNLKRIKLLEEKAAIAYKVKFGNYQVSNKEFAAIPKGWSVKSIDEIYGKLESGSRPKGGINKELNEGIASVGAENVIGLGKYNYQSEKLITLTFFDNMNRGKIEDRDILIYKDGAYIGKTTLFQDGFPHEKCCVNEHVFLLTSKDTRYQYFLFFTLNQGLYFEKMQQLNANAAQPGINQESLKSLKLIWPSEDMIKEFNKEVEANVKLIFVLVKQSTKLREARDILLPRLLNGEIEV